MGKERLWKKVSCLVNRDALTANGMTIWENVVDAQCGNREVIRPFKEPFKSQAKITVLRGILAPNGPVVKTSAASPHLLEHSGRAVVFENVEELHSRLRDESLDIDENCVMVLKNCGPRGYPGMAESETCRYRPSTDVVRVFDTRMSGTAQGTVVLHVSPEAATALNALKGLCALFSGPVIDLRAILLTMPNTKTDRSNCQFILQQTSDGKPVIVVQLLHETIPTLRNAAVGFDLLTGIKAEQSKRLVESLNEYVLNVFVTVTEKGATA